MKSLKRTGLMSLIVMVIVAVLTACDYVPADTMENNLKNSSDKIAANQSKLEKNQPAPEITYSLERQNQIDRSKIINDKNRLGYLYLLSDDGKVVDFVVIKGKVSSTKSYLVPDEQIVDDPYNASSTSLTVQAPDIDGSYGENQEAIYFFEADGQMGEWNGKYRYSTKPLKMTTQPVLLQEKK
jgi:hypothetical protein